MIKCIHMRKLFSVIGISSMIILSAVFAVNANANSNVDGRILLQVEENGEAWYVLPDTSERFYLADGDIAYAGLRTFGLGITNSDLDKIPVGLALESGGEDSDGDGLSDQLEEALHSSLTEIDSDHDGYDDKTEIEGGYNPIALGAMEFDSELTERLKGQILIQVEDLGQAWYLNPDDGKRYYMKDGDAAYEIMRYLSLGITNDDLATITTDNSMLDCGDNKACLVSAVEKDYWVSGDTRIINAGVYIYDVIFTNNQTSIDPYEATFTIEFVNWDFTEEFYEDSIGYGKTEEEIRAMVQEDSADLSGYIESCSTNDKDSLLIYVENSDINEMFDSILQPVDFATCVELVS